MFFFSVYDLTNVMKWNDMIWIFVFFFEWNFARPYVHVWQFLGLEIKCNQINEMIWMKLVFFVEAFHVCTYTYRFFFSVYDQTNLSNQINEMKWVFVYFLGWNFTLLYVRVWKFLGLEMKWEWNQWNDLNETCFFDVSFSRLYIRVWKIFLVFWIW